MFTQTFFFYFMVKALKNSFLSLSEMCCVRMVVYSHLNVGAPPNHLSNYNSAHCFTMDIVISLDPCDSEYL